MYSTKKWSLEGSYGTVQTHKIDRPNDPISRNRVEGVGTNEQIMDDFYKDKSGLQVEKSWELECCRRD